jgi:hypothetical protein
MSCTSWPSLGLSAVSSRVSRRKSCSAANIMWMSGEAASLETLVVDGCVLAGNLARRALPRTVYILDLRGHVYLVGRGDWEFCFAEACSVTRSLPPSPQPLNAPRPPRSTTASHLFLELIPIMLMRIAPPSKVWREQVVHALVIRGVRFCFYPRLYALMSWAGQLERRTC